MAPPEVQLPNGMAWREGSALVYFVDSGEESITEYATDEQVSFVGRCFVYSGEENWGREHHYGDQYCNAAPHMRLGECQGMT